MPGDLLPDVLLVATGEHRPRGARSTSHDLPASRERQTAADEEPANDGFPGSATSMAMPPASITLTIGPPGGVVRGLVRGPHAGGGPLRPVPARRSSSPGPSSTNRVRASGRARQPPQRNPCRGRARRCGTHRRSPDESPGGPRHCDLAGSRPSPGCPGGMLDRAGHWVLPVGDGRGHFPGVAAGDPGRGPPRPWWWRSGSVRPGRCAAQGPPWLLDLPR